MSYIYHDIGVVDDKNVEIVRSDIIIGIQISISSLMFVILE